eukprot:527193-Prorocentrum_minimum.AAC.1
MLHFRSIDIERFATVVFRFELFKPFFYRQVRSVAHPLLLPLVRKKLRKTLQLSGRPLLFVARVAMRLAAHGRHGDAGDAGWAVGVATDGELFASAAGNSEALLAAGLVGRVRLQLRQRPEPADPIAASQPPSQPPSQAPSQPTSQPPSQPYAAGRTRASPPPEKRRERGKERERRTERGEKPFPSLHCTK